MNRRHRLSPLRFALAALALGLLGSAASAEEGALDRLVKAYPDFLVSQDGTTLTWKDGARTPISDGRTAKSFTEKLKSASILDQMSLTYVPGKPSAVPGREDDPGRFRNIAFFDKMYGDCSKGGVEGKLVKVAWLPKSGGGSVRATTVNGVAAKLASVSAELDQLPPAIRRHAYPSAGTYNCRVVADTGVRSAHAWGIAIDINTDSSDYWLWSKGAYKNRVPWEIVEIFERHGFIWGGKWGHFDTMHFEYRPELL